MFFIDKSNAIQFAVYATILYIDEEKRNQILHSDYNRLRLTLGWDQTGKFNPIISKWCLFLIGQTEIFSEIKLKFLKCEFYICSNDA